VWGAGDAVGVLGVRRLGRSWVSPNQPYFPKASILIEAQSLAEGRGALVRGGRLDADATFPRGEVYFPGHGERWRYGEVASASREGLCLLPLLPPRRGVSNLLRERKARRVQANAQRPTVLGLTLRPA
jgi:hypothetical protein